jgi:hypothetical protein
MNKLVFFLIPFLLQMSLAAQENNVTIGKYRKFESNILGGEVTYLEHLPDGYEKSGKINPDFETAKKAINKLNNQK